MARELSTLQGGTIKLSFYIRKQRYSFILTTFIEKINSGNLIM